MLLLILCIYIHLNLIDGEEAADTQTFLTDLENSERWKSLPGSLPEKEVCRKM